MAEKIRPFLMFHGEAEEAMNFYLSLFLDSKMVEIRRYGPEGPGREGTVMRATLSLDGSEIMCIDSSVRHPFTFTPATSLFVTCETDEEITRLAAMLGKGGKIFMPLDAYPFATKFTWLADRFGVSWQLTLA
ncbi:MAG: VOC family protein [Proteobacteria bacterium]|nr:VOC family protein [Pseudomonadota bacterium]